MCVCVCVCMISVPYLHTSPVNVVAIISLCIGYAFQCPLHLVLVQTSPDHSPIFTTSVVYMFFVWISHCSSCVISLLISRVNVSINLGMSGIYIVRSYMYSEFSAQGQIPD